MGWLSKLFNLDLWTDEAIGAVPAVTPSETKTEAQGSAGEQSKQDAKNRLKLVLMHDRTQLSSEVLEKMRVELVEVISRYVEIDKDALEINLESESNTIALVANIPMVKFRKDLNETQETDQKAETPAEPANTKGTDDTADDLAEDLINAVEASEAKKDEPPKKASL